MCGRVYVKSTLAGLMASFAHVQRGDVESMGNDFPRWNGAPGRDYPIIVREPDMAGPTFKRATWGFIPSWAKGRGERRPPINARAEGIATSGMFKAAYRSRRYRAVLKPARAAHAGVSAAN